MTSVRIILAAVIAAALSAGCANTGQWDPVFSGNASLMRGVPAERMGMLFGSIAIAHEEKAIEGLWLTLHSQSTGESVVIHATKRMLTNHRKADIETESERIWVFSGQLPTGEYRIVEMTLDHYAGFGGSRLWPSVAIRLPTQLSVNAGETIYMGRWSAQEQGRPMRNPQKALVWEGRFRAMLRSAFSEDKATVDRLRLERKDWPAMHAPVVNPLRMLEGPGLPTQDS